MMMVKSEVLQSLRDSLSSIEFSILCPCRSFRLGAMRTPPRQSTAYSSVSSHKSAATHRDFGMSPSAASAKQFSSLSSPTAGESRRRRRRRRPHHCMVPCRPDHSIKPCRPYHSVIFSWPGPPRL